MFFHLDEFGCTDKPRLVHGVLSIPAKVDPSHRDFLQKLDADLFRAFQLQRLEHARHGIAAYSQIESGVSA